MELRQLRYVLAVAETGNFTRAAERCYVVQSALSHQIAALERELGFALFARTSRRVAITPAGTAFLDGARQCLAAAERAVADAAAAAGEVRGHLSIGMIPTVTALAVPALLRRFSDAHPQVRVGLRVAASNEIVAGIRAGELDIGVLGLPPDERPRGVRWRELGRDRHVAVLPPGHGLAGRRRIGLERLADQRFADFPVGSAGRAQTDRAFAAAGLARTVAYEATAVELILELVREGQAVALLPSEVVPARAGVPVVDVTRGPARVQYLAWSAFDPSPAALAFLDLAAR
ncbi:DNA-binding transcriptional LysR family regulator [Naumannella cuiyingiana]|uniref:DNA-binding transcriptional LysR family regulator n=1 Tax=Naumannella cuiyingiana TaxID=1347891 RepID=A0A7Z0IJY3_9ACTN|nr:LysR family transcriptional regulator [Naumannella cuiyingiana]NYI69933.1 DNA-binding transcriptional LysR family regulator [Naumannella cuiyingiana]